MAYSYEAVVATPVFDIFERAFTTYMERLDCCHMSIGRLGAHSSHQFRIDGSLISLTTSAEGQSLVRIVIHSDTVPVEHMVLDALTEGVADFLQNFVDSLTDQSSEQVVLSLIQDLRDAFDRVVGEERELVL